jgi:hypothetical protein
LGGGVWATVTCGGGTATCGDGAATCGSGAATFAERERSSGEEREERERRGKK